MWEINWKKFEIKNPKATEAFETLCYFLFCRKFNITEGIRTDFNQVGLETEPVKDSNGEYWGFQSKFFDKKINYNNIASSIGKALEHYSDLKHIIIYLNQEAQTSCKNAQAIEKRCLKAGVSVEWFLPENFKISLNNVKNRDLAEFYFGETDAIRVLSDSKDIRLNTLLQSKEYVELKLQKQTKSIKISDYSNEIMKSAYKLHLFSGAAGSGKSVCMRKLFNIYGGFECEKEKEQQKVINETGALCIFVSLNKTSLDSLENIIYAYKNFYSLNNQHNKFIYLLDGLDEVPNSSITGTILFIEELLEKESTKKVIISSRLSSNNKIVLKTAFSDVSEYTIKNLEPKEIEEYFENKNDEKKMERLKELHKKIPHLYDNVTDILTLAMLWKYIFQITDANVFPELMELSVNATLDDIHHRKNLDTLNLPNPKEAEIIELNKKLAFYLFENDQFSFNQQQLNKVIGETFPRCDYKSVNEIAGYLADNFFDSSITDNMQTYAYRHRRFLEYFTLLSIENKIQKNMNYLREKKIIINQDLFDNMLIPYLHSKAIKNQDLPLSFEVGLFNVYMGNDKAWGVEKNFYYWSSWIVYAIAALPDHIFQNLVEDSSLPISNFFTLMPEKLISIARENDKPKYNSDFNQYYLNFVLLISLLHKFQKNEWLNKMLVKYDEFKEICLEKGILFNTTSNKENNLMWESIFYIETVIYNESIDKYADFFLEKVNGEINSIMKEYVGTEIHAARGFYYNLLLFHPKKCTEIISRMSMNQISLFIFAAVKAECLPIICENSEIKEALTKKLNCIIEGSGLGTALCLSMKQMLGGTLSETEKAEVSSYLKENPFREYSIFWKECSDATGFILSIFDDLIDIVPIDSSVRQYIEAYKKYMSLLENKITISGFVSEVRDYLNRKSNATYCIRILLGKALAVCSDDDLLVKGTMDYLNYNMKNGGLYIVYHMMKLHNLDRFKKLATNSVLKVLNDPKNYRDIGYESTSDVMFMLAFIISEIDEKVSCEILLQGICNGMLRMNERKDTIGDYKLLEGLEELLKNNWLSEQQLKEYLDRIILIANKMDIYHIDNDVHGQLIEILLKYDFEMAEYYYREIEGKIGSYNEIHFRFAEGLAYRGRKIEDIENVLYNMVDSYDNYFGKMGKEGNDYKIRIYLYLATCDFYSENEKSECFKKVREELDCLEGKGWEKELDSAEYKIYVDLCNKYQMENDVHRAREYNFDSVKKRNELNSLNEIKRVRSIDELKVFMEKMNREIRVDNLESNQMLIQKCIDLSGNINDILNLMEKKYYPSSINVSTNGMNFWMTVVAALQNPKAKGSMMRYLLEQGGGHDGFSELIKVFGEMKNKNMCIRTFDIMLNCVEFLLYD